MHVRGYAVRRDTAIGHVGQWLPMVRRLVVDCSHILCGSP